MEAIRNWAMTICVTLAGASLFSMLVPNSGMKKMATFTINLFLVSSLVSPLLLDPPDLDFYIITEETSTNEQLEETADEQVYAQAEQQLKLQLEELFEQNGTKINDIEIDINITEEVQTVQVTLWADSSQEADRQRVEELVLDAIGVQPEIIYTGE